MVEADHDPTDAGNKETFMGTSATPPGRRNALVPEVWRDFYRETHIPAAVQVAEALRLTGHTGETADGAFSSDAESQIRQTFRNIALTLAEAGADWSDVVEITSYHVGLLSQAEATLRVAAEFLHDPYPAWTAVGVTELFLPEAVVEISCIAVLSADR
jgi:enamine deaminase RidA (YjgF/YER057c/UK114 family)